jgi:glycosyltransferase involved in cell wall biosynthesis
VRVGFDAKRLFLNNRGLGNYARNLLYGLEKYHPANAYYLYTPRSSNEYVSPTLLNSENVYVRTPEGIAKRAGSLWRSFGLGFTTQPDNLDIYHGLSHEIPRDYKKTMARVLVTVHDLIFLKHREFYRPVDRWIYTKKISFAIQNSDKIIAISRQTKDDILYEFAVDEDKISIVYQSCNEVFYSKRESSELNKVKAKWRLPDNYILYVGALNENKNIRIIIDAIIAQGEAIDLPIVIVGRGGDYKRKLIEKASKHGLLRRLHFASDIADPSPRELSSFYQMASVFVFPSFYEGFGIPILEARFSGVPVVASNSSCLDEAGGKHSLYFNPNSAEELAERLQAALTSPEKFTISYPEEFKLEPLTNQMLDLYKSLL